MSSRSALLLFLFTSLSIAQPVISTVTNAAGNTPPDLPSSGIAQGSMFVLKGSGLGPAAIVVDNEFPFTTSVGGTSVRVSVGGSTQSAILYYAFAGQVAAILPSTTPVGQGTVTVTYNGETSASYPIRVVRSTLGIFTVNQSGGGDSIATRADTLVGPLNAVNPGEVVAFWGTGLGPITADETTHAPQFDMTDVAVEAWVSGKPAQVVFRGRNACCAGVDTIYIRIPDGVTGCQVPVVFKIGDTVSNTTYVPTAPSGRVCAPNLPGFTPQDVQSSLSKPRFTFASISLSRASHLGPELGAAADGGSAGGTAFTPLPNGLGAALWDSIPLGSCGVTVGEQFIGAWLSAAPSPIGNPVTVTGPQGSRLMNGSGTLAFFGAAGTFLQPGNFQISAPAGLDFGAIDVTLPFRDPILQWSNRDSLSTVDRSAGVTVRWTGGDPNGMVRIQGFATAGEPTFSRVGSGAQFACLARTSDGQFTVPPYVTMALPQSEPAYPPAVTVGWPSSLWVVGVSEAMRIRPTNLDLGIAQQWIQHGRTVRYVGGN